MPKMNYDDPTCYYYLNALLSEAGVQHLAAVQTEQFRRGLEGILQLPEGSARQAALSALNNGVACCSRERAAREELAVLKLQLATEQPALSEFKVVADCIQRSFTELLRKFKQVYDQDAATGRDMWKTAWPWFEHELIVAEGGAKFHMRRLQKILDDGEQAPAAPPAPKAP